MPTVSFTALVPSWPGGLVFGHRAVYISFAPASQCLAAPEIYKALHPKNVIFLIAVANQYFEPISFDFYRGYIFVGTGRDLSARGLYL